MNWSTITRFQCHSWLLSLTLWELYVSLLIVNYLLSKTSIIWISNLFPPTWWRLFQKLVIRIDFDVNVFIIGVFCLYGLSICHVLYYSLFLVFNLRVIFVGGIYILNEYLYMLRTSIFFQSFHVVIVYPSYSSFSTSIFHYCCIITCIRWLMTHSFFNMPASDWFNYNYNASERIDRRDIWRYQRGNQKP